MCQEAIVVLVKSVCNKEVALTDNTIPVYIEAGVREFSFGPVLVQQAFGNTSRSRLGAHTCLHNDFHICMGVKERHKSTKVHTSKGSRLCFGL